MTEFSSGPVMTEPVFFMVFILSDPFLATATLCISWWIDLQAQIGLVLVTDPRAKSIPGASRAAALAGWTARGCRH